MHTSSGIVSTKQRSGHSSDDIIYNLSILLNSIQSNSIILHYIIKRSLLHVNTVETYKFYSPILVSSCSIAEVVNLQSSIVSFFYSIRDEVTTISSSLYSFLLIGCRN